MGWDGPPLVEGRLDPHISNTTPYTQVEDFPQLIHAFLRERVRQHRACLTQQEQEQEEQEQE